MTPQDAAQLVSALGAERTVVFLDLATTGVEVRKARIVQIAVARIEPGGETPGTPSIITKLVNPGVPIPAEATAVHGIDDDDVADAPPFRAYARSLLGQLEGCDFAGFGIARYDLPVLEREFRRAGFTFEWRGRNVIDAMAIFHAREPRDLAAALRFYGVDGGEVFSPAHDAETGLNAAMAVIGAQMAHYPDLPRDAASLNLEGRPEIAHWADSSGRFLRDGDDGTVVFGFGRYEGTALAVVAAEDPDYLLWLREQELPEDARTLVDDALERTSPS